MYRNFALFSKFYRTSIVLNLLTVYCSLSACAQSTVSSNWAASTDDQLTKSQNMEAARASHTATLLNDGRVLITGGFVVEGTTLNGAELFDAGSGKFSPAMNMNQRRSSHTATLLPNGRVLIAGGFDGNYLNNAEVFDPTTNKFMQVGKMIEPRSNHVAILLNNGKVLIAGGVGTGWTFLASAEIFDPQTNLFSRTGDMTISRESHTAALLPDGKVLVAGGHSGRRSAMRVFAQTEIYDPATGKFSSAGEMTIRRHKHDAIALSDGRILIVGGSNELDARDTYKSAEVYDPRSGKFSAINDMIQARYKLQGTSVRLPNGKVLIGGGANNAEVFDPVSNTFSPVKGNMDDIKLFATATLLRDGRVLIAGGYNLRVNVSASTWVLQDLR